MLAAVSNEEEVCDVIERFYSRMRRTFRTQGVVISRHGGGGEIANYHFGDMKILDPQSLVGGLRDGHGDPHGSTVRDCAG
jgi:hypothetical protein